MKVSDQFIRVVKRCRRLFGWVPCIESGPAKGLRFNPGPATWAFVSGKYESPVQEAVSSLVHAGDVFCDIGANVGFFSVLAGQLIGPSGAVYAFEPVPKNASMVERNARLNNLGNIKVLRIAASRNTGKSELLLARHAGGAVLRSAGTPPDLAGRLVVETSSIDDLVRSQQIRPPDVVKIDVEGAELDVLNGTVETLRRWAPKLIIEVDDADQEKCEEKLSVCRAFLQDLRYDTEVLDNSYRDGTWFVRHFVAFPRGS